MNIDFELYRVFNEVANFGNITAAAEQLHISQPAVSKSIKLLESQLGGPLFVRTKRGVILTEEGKELHNYIKIAIDYIRNAENKFGNMMTLETGVIRIGISRTLVKEFLLPYLEKFHKLYPKIKIEIDTNVTSKLIPKLQNGLIDFIVTNLPVKISNDIVSRNVKEVQDIFVVNPDFPIDSYDIKLEDIKNYPLVMLPKGTVTRDFLDTFLANNNIFIDPEMSLGSYGLVKDMAQIGLGMGYVVEEFVQDELKNKKFIKINTTPKVPSRYIGLLTKKDAIPSFATKKLIDMVID